MSLLRQSLLDSFWPQQTQPEEAQDAIEDEEGQHRSNSQNEKKTAQRDAQRKEEPVQAQRAEQKRCKSDNLELSRLALDTAVDYCTLLLRQTRSLQCHDMQRCSTELDQQAHRPLTERFYTRTEKTQNK